jgi:hypothetical protein
MLQLAYAYDIGRNFVLQKKNNGINNSYIWDYQNFVPVASVVNGDSSNIAYTSFEAQNSGNWSYSGTPIIDYTCPTGRKIYVLNGSNNITRSSLNSGITFILSYWTRNSSPFTVTGTVSGYPITGRSVDGWKYFEHKISGQSTITISGTGAIDELRLYPDNAQMTTYTYDAIIGMTSQCDPNNRTAYFEYDGVGRLSIIKDLDKRIVKKICYNYAGRPEDCSSGYFVNILKTGSYTKNNCGAGYSGTAVIDSVYAGTYSSPVSQAYVDSLAQADVYANGQSYANTHGSCNCDAATCLGPSQQCIFNSCFTGDLKCVSSVFNSKSNLWTCTYRYVFSIDCSSNFAFTTQSASSCPVDPPCH